MINTKHPNVPLISGTRICSLVLSTQPCFPSKDEAVSILSSTRISRFFPSPRWDILSYPQQALPITIYELVKADRSCFPRFCSVIYRKQAPVEVKTNLWFLFPLQQPEAGKYGRKTTRKRLMHNAQSAPKPVGNNSLLFILYFCVLQAVPVMTKCAKVSNCRLVFLFKIIYPLLSALYSHFTATNFDGALCNRTFSFIF